MLLGKSEAYSVLYDMYFGMYSFWEKLKFLPVIGIRQYLSLAGILASPSDRYSAIPITGRNFNNNLPVMGIHEYLSLAGILASPSDRYS